ncbi:MAG: recombination-associated protein RdgC [Burkholderiales bacterium]|nr:recombination-associated protein RdgC [Burkholderiales bacterium]
MFKQLTAYRLDPATLPGADEFASALQRERFLPCAPTQALAVGWVAPRGEPNAPLAERIAGMWQATLCFEQRLLPPSVLREQVQARAARIEQETGLRPGRRALRELRDELTLELLPRAFTRRAAVQAWIDPAQGWLWLDAGSAPRLDATLTAIVKTLPKLAPRALHGAESPAVAMREWLASGEPPAGFDIDRDCTLQAADGTRAAVRYARHALDPQDLQRHLDAGLMPTRLALTWRGRVSFELTESLQLRKLALLDLVLDEGGRGASDAGFDADVALRAGELRALLPELLDALGGEVVPDAA